MTEAMEEEDNIIVKWAQEDVETSYNLLNNNNNNIFFQVTDYEAYKYIHTIVLPAVYFLHSGFEYCHQGIILPASFRLMVTSEHMQTCETLNCISSCP